MTRHFHAGRISLGWTCGELLCLRLQRWCTGLLSFLFVFPLFKFEPFSLWPIHLNISLPAHKLPASFPFTSILILTTRNLIWKQCFFKDYIILSYNLQVLLPFHIPEQFRPKTEEPRTVSVGPLSLSLSLSLSSSWQRRCNLRAPVLS